MSFQYVDRVDCFVLICDSYESKQRFKQLILRGINSWDQAHPELKELYDVLEHGRVLQNYSTQGHTN